MKELKITIECYEINGSSTLMPIKKPITFHIHSSNVFIEIENGFGYSINTSQIKELIRPVIFDIIKDVVNND